ncbi:MAG: thiamine pyrophosphate-dependent enzyme, partial [Pseudomonadota bacterium]
ALLGDANMNWATRLAEGCRLIYVRHEHCAVAAAMAYARKTGQPGIATVTCGPGLTQIMTGLPAAVRARLPLVVFAGEAPLTSGWYNQAIDQAPLVTATGAIYHSLHDVSLMPAAVRDAFIETRSTRRPVVLGIPMDLQNRPWAGPQILPSPSRDLIPDCAPMPPNPEDLERAARLIDGAERIVVMAGLGAVEAEAALPCRTLAARIDALLATTLPARGFFHDDAFSLGIAGGFSTETAREMLADADLIVAVGCSLASHNADAGKIWPDAKVLQIDTAPVAISQGRIAAHAHLRADAGLGTAALAEAVRPKQTAWRTEKTARKLRKPSHDREVFPVAPGEHDPRDVVAALDAALPGDWQLVNSSGHCSYFFAQMPRRRQTHFLTIREFGAIGNGISFAMGVAAACLGERVVLFDGDGSLMMHVQELETIQRHGLDVLIAVMNDGAYGSEIHKLRSESTPAPGPRRRRGCKTPIRDPKVSRSTHP